MAAQNAFVVCNDNVDRMQPEKSETAREKEGTKEAKLADRLTSVGRQRISLVVSKPSNRNVNIFSRFHRNTKKDDIISVME